MPVSVAHIRRRLNIRGTDRVASLSLRDRAGRGAARVVVAWCSALVLCATISPRALVAQGAPPAGDPRAAMLAEAQKAISAYAWLVGEWEGTATIYMNNGGKMSLVQHETVTSAAFGTALIIQGRGTMDRNGTPQQVWDAAAIFAYNAPSKKFSFTSASGSGMAQMFAVEPRGDGFVWSFDESRGAKTRYVITRSSDGKWTEVGETSSDGGATWTKTIDLVLTKRK